MIVTDEDYLDFTKVPESRGVPHLLYRVLIVGLFVIFCIGGSVVMTSGYGHHWPADTTMRTPLHNNQ